MPRGPTFLVLVLASVWALAADDEPVPRPTLNVGDCWSYRVEIDNSGTKSNGDYELCLTYIDKGKDAILGVATLRNDGREFDVSFSSEWAARVGAGGVLLTPEFKFYRFPLFVGDTYKDEFEFREVRKGVNAGKMRWTVKVVGWEEVTVPAGTFRALKMEGRASGERTDIGLKYNSSQTRWYVPAIKRYVKYQSKDWPDRGDWTNQREEVLTEFRIK